MTIQNALIVDDSKSARMMLQRLLEKMNVVANAVESAEEALQYLENQRPDVIFMDHMMPGMDGLEATQTIKSNPKTSAIPTIMYTSKNDDDGYRSLAESHGASGVLAKPANQQAIMSVIQSLNETAANDVPEKAEPEFNLEEIEKIVAKQLRRSVLEAKAEIAAGLDTVSQQLQQSQQERLQQAEQSLRQHIQPLQQKMQQFGDEQTTYQKLKPQLQKQMLVIADKVSRQKAEEQALATSTQIEQFKGIISDLNKELTHKTHKAMITGLAGGAAIGAVIGIIAALIF